MYVVDYGTNQISYFATGSASPTVHTLSVGSAPNEVGSPRRHLRLCDEQRRRYRLDGRHGQHTKCHGNHQRRQRQRSAGVSITPNGSTVYADWRDQHRFLLPGRRHFSDPTLFRSEPLHSISARFLINKEPEPDSNILRARGLESPLALFLPCQNKPDSARCLPSATINRWSCDLQQMLLQALSRCTRSLMPRTRRKPAPRFAVRSSKGSEQAGDESRGPGSLRIHKAY